MGGSRIPQIRKVRTSRRGSLRGRKANRGGDDTSRCVSQNRRDDNVSWRCVTKRNAGGAVVMTCCTGVSQAEGWEASDDMLPRKTRGRGASCRVQDSAQKGAAREGALTVRLKARLGAY